MKRFDDAFETDLLRRAFVGIALFLVILLVGAVVSESVYRDTQPAYWIVTILQLLDVAVLVAAGAWAVADRQLPQWVPPVTLAFNCLLAIAIVACSQGHRNLSIALFLVDGAQFLLAFGFFIRRHWITVLSGAALLALGWGLFLWLPRSTFPQQLSDGQVEEGFLFLLFFGLSMITGFVAVNNGIARRVTERAQDIAERLRVAAFQDSATGLPNGLQLEQDLKDWEAAGTKGNLDKSRTLVLAGFRLDGLEELNESHGVEVTTQIVAEVARDYAQELQDLARRHPRVVRPDPFRQLYRVESNLFLFALMLPDAIQTMTNQGALAGVIERLQARKTSELRLGFQGGFTCFPEDAITPRQLLRNLLNLLHSRRAEHLGQFTPFNHDLYREHLRREALRQALGTSLTSREFRLVYQPKVKTSNGEFSGFEALARWNGAQLGQVSPMEFIPLAEQSGQIAELTSQLLDQAFDYLIRLNSAGFPDASVGVNLSPGVFVPEFLERVVDRLNGNGLGPQLDIEITEGVLMHLSGPLHDSFTRLKALGVSFSIDDFGTGYSNLGYLQNLEADILKIDKRFIDGIPHAEKNAKLVTAIIQMAHSLGMAVVAEGVEYREQRDFLAEAGCDQIQGYYYSKPLDPEAAMDYVKKHTFGRS